MKLDCIVNVATGRYVKGQKRLLSGLERIGFRGDVLAWTDELPQGAPSIEEAPFAFKSFAIKHALDTGYRRVLWLDVNFMPVRSLDRIFHKIEHDGYYLYSLGASFGEWCSDSALSRFGLSREKSFSILEIAASCMGFSVDSAEAMEFLDELIALARDGETFRGVSADIPAPRAYDNRDLQVSSDSRVKGHRHDQTAASFLAWKHRFHFSGTEIKNFRSVGPSGENRYAKAIPFCAALLHNRDISEWEMPYLDSVDRFGNARGVNRLIFFLFSMLDTYRSIRSVASINGRTKAKGYYSAN